MILTDVPELGSHVLLAIDTAIGTTVALGAGGRVWSAESENARGHAEAIGTLLLDVFEESGVAPARVTGVVAGVDRKSVV